MKMQKNRFEQILHEHYKKKVRIQRMAENTSHNRHIKKLKIH